jgi:hypothetical protein
MAGDQDSDNTRVEISISNAIPGGVHPWHVHRGQCGNDQGIFGPADAYKPLRVNDDGRASAVAKLPMPLPKTGNYFVSVHASTASPETVIACGNLAHAALSARDSGSRSRRYREGR